MSNLIYTLKHTGSLAQFLKIPGERVCIGFW